MVLKFCLSQFVMEVNLYMEYQKNLRISNLFCVDLTWNYPIASYKLLKDKFRTGIRKGSCYFKNLIRMASGPKLVRVYCI